MTERYREVVGTQPVRRIRMSDFSTDLKDTVSGIDFDPEALRAKYRQERDKRIRTDGNEQYVEVNGDFTRYIDDPYADPRFTPAPLDETVEVLITGGGFGGLLAGARLREARFQGIRILEKGGAAGRPRHCDPRP